MRIYTIKINDEDGTVINNYKDIHEAFNAFFTYLDEGLGDEIRGIKADLKEEAELDPETVNDWKDYLKEVEPAYNEAMIILKTSYKLQDFIGEIEIAEFGSIYGKEL